MACGRGGLDGLRLGHRRTRRRILDLGLELGQGLPDRPGAAGVDLLEVGQQVDEGRLGAVAERDGLLDLEVLGDLAVRHPAAVLHGDQLDEAQELLGAARLLLGGERRGGEAGQDLVGGLSCLDERLSAARSGCRQRIERCPGLLGGGRSSLLLELRRQDASSTPRPVRRARRGGRQSRCPRHRRPPPRSPACAPGRRRAGPSPRRARPARGTSRRRPELLDRRGAVGAGSREPRGRPELADQQPAGGLLRMVVGHGIDCRLVAAAVDRGTCRSARRCQGGAVLLVGRGHGVGERRTGRAVRVRGDSPQRPGQPGLVGGLGSACGITGPVVAEQDRLPGVEQTRADLLRRIPRLGRRRAGRGRRDRGQHEQRRRQRDPDATAQAQPVISPPGSRC